LEQACEAGVEIIQLTFLTVIFYFFSNPISHLYGG